MHTGPSALFSGNLSQFNRLDLWKPVQQVKWIQQYQNHHIQYILCYYLLYWNSVHVHFVGSSTTFHVAIFITIIQIWILTGNIRNEQSQEARRQSNSVLDCTSNYELWRLARWPGEICTHESDVRRKADEERSFGIFEWEDNVCLNWILLSKTMIYCSRDGHIWTSQWALSFNKKQRITWPGRGLYSRWGHCIFQFT
jgi:hypothetical protein